MTKSKFTNKNNSISIVNLEDELADDKCKFYKEMISLGEIINVILVKIS